MMRFDDEDERHEDEGEREVELSSFCTIYWKDRWIE